MYLPVRAESLGQHKTDPSTVQGIGFDAICSVAVSSHETGEPIPVTSGFLLYRNDRNVILWLDNRPIAETKMINLTGYHLLHFVSG